jgi:hypothetical protein
VNNQHKFRVTQRLEEGNLDDDNITIDKATSETTRSSTLRRGKGSSNFHDPAESKHQANNVRATNFSFHDRYFRRGDSI